MRISDWSSDVCSSDLPPVPVPPTPPAAGQATAPAASMPDMPMDHSAMGHDMGTMDMGDMTMPMDHDAMEMPAPTQPRTPIPALTDADRAAAVPPHQAHPGPANKSEERRGGQEGDRTGKNPWS